MSLTPHGMSPEAKARWAERIRAREEATADHMFEVSLHDWPDYDFSAYRRRAITEAESEAPELAPVEAGRWDDSLHGKLAGTPGSLAKKGRTEGWQVEVFRSIAPRERGGSYPTVPRSEFVGVGFLKGPDWLYGCWYRDEPGDPWKLYLALDWSAYLENRPTRLSATELRARVSGASLAEARGATENRRKKRLAAKQDS